MFTTHSIIANRAHGCLSWGTSWLWLVFCSWGVTSASLRAQEAGPEQGAFITVDNPITSDVMSWVKDRIERARGERQIRKIVLDFNPDGKPSGSPLYGPCRDLANYLQSLHDVQTIAYVRQDVTQHTVLPVLACKDLVMASRAHLGDALRGQSEPLAEDQLRFYRQVARHPGRWPIIWKMLDKNVEVLEATRGGGIWYVARGQEPEEGVVVLPRGPVLPAGNVGLYTAAEALRFGLCKLIKESRQEVAEAYQLSPSSLRDDPLEGRSPVPWRIEVNGTVNRALKETLERRLRRAIGQGGNLIFLELDCGGGDPLVARDIADFLRDLKDSEGRYPVMTVAYIPRKAPDTATFIALGCSEIVMGRAAELGDFDALVYQRRGGQRIPIEEGTYDLMRQSLMSLAESQGYSPLLFRGLLDRDLEIHRVRGNENERRLMSGAELATDRERAWRDEGTIKHQGEFLVLNAPLARELGVARHLVDNSRELYAVYGVNPGQVREAGPDWLDSLATFLRYPTVSVLLIMVGFVCLVLELKIPGFGLPGILAALCFILFFWSHSQLAGQITMLAVLLFVLGLALIALEIFVVPGFGVTGISGILLVLAGLGLATLEKKPETSQEWMDFGGTLTTFGLTFVGAVVAAMLVGRYLPYIPYANRLVLVPPGERPEEAALEDHGPAPHLAALLGAIGVAATTLRPAGMARFGDNYVDVVTEGSFVSAGARVQVIEIEGNRIVVKEV
ncbi:MAG: NfeD family protein [Gemmataceae bacterium]